MTRQRIEGLARAVFLVLVVVACVWAFRDHGPEILDAIRSTPVPAVLAAAALVVGGLLVTSVAWLALLRSFGHELDGPTGRSVFFLGQLGKYLPGGVWSIGAHAHLARDHGVPVRVTASTSLAFLGLNLATAAVVVGVVGAAGAPVGPLTPGASALLGVAGLAALLPPVVSRLAGRVAGVRPRLGYGTVAFLVVLMAVTWGCYATALVVLAPDPSTGLLPTAASAFTLSYAIGVAVVVAPAGVGAREVTLVALLSPALGLTAAGAIAILTRVIHTGADLLLALVAWGLDRLRQWRRARRERSAGQVARA